MFTQRITTGLLTFAAAALIGGTAAHAQRFEDLVSNSPGNEWGESIVTCPVNGGYIAVGGTDNTSCLNSNDVLVTRINANGTFPLGWPKRYDIGGICGYDYAYSVIECTNGDFVIAGGTTTSFACGAPGQGSSFLMRINATGGVVWVRAYSYGAAFSVVEATIGNMGTTFPGDLIFCGDGAGSGTAYIARANGNNGTLIWDQGYATSTGGIDRFTEVIEGTIAGSGAGDVIACGYGAGAGGVVARVDGNTGGIAGPLQGIADYPGGSTALKLQSIQELKVGSLTGDLVTTGPVPNAQVIQVMRLSPNPCVVNANAVHVPGGVGAVPQSIREIVPTSTSLFTTAGNLVVTGHCTPAVNANFDMFLMEIDPTTLLIVTSGVHVYDATGAGQSDGGRSVAVVYDAGIFPPAPPSDGFIMCGVTSLGANGSEMYIVKTDAAHTELASCNDGSVSYSSSTPVMTPNCPGYSYAPFLNSCAVTGTTSTTMGRIRNCFGFPKEATPDAGTSEAALTLAGTPNPVRGGTEISLALTSAEAAPVTIIVTDASGRTIATAKRTLKSGANTLTLETGGWAPGAYVVTATAAGETAAVQIVVVE